MGGGIATVGSVQPARVFAQTRTSGRGVCSAPGLSYSAIYVAKQRDLWSANAVDYSLKLVQGGPLAMTALTTGEADFACVAANDPLIAWDKGIKTLVVAAFTSAVAMQMAARGDWMKKIGLSAASSADDKVKALKTARIGVSTIGGGPAQYIRYLATLNGMDERELKLLPVGFGAARVSALRENQVDVIVGSAPDADEVALQGIGEFYLSFATDIPAFKDMPYTVLVVTPDSADKRPAAVRAIARTIGQANDFLQSNFNETLAILKGEFPKIDARAIELSMQRDRASFPRGALMAQPMWDNAIQMARSLRTVKSTPPAGEGEFWTNKFLS
jgi:NitT/TauT family transport system substrate-binding protein